MAATLKVQAVPIIALTVSTSIPAGLPTPAGPPQTAPPRFSFQDTRDGGSSVVQAGAPVAPTEEEDNAPQPSPTRTRTRELLGS
jgi:hypothetical protein